MSYETSKQGFFKYPRSDHVEKPIRNLAEKKLKQENTALSNNMEDKPQEDPTEKIQELMNIALRACKELGKICQEVELSQKKKERIEKIMLDGRQFAKGLKMTDEKKKFTEIYNSLQDED